jgi:hypothetical protein
MERTKMRRADEHAGGSREHQRQPADAPSRNGGRRPEGRVLALLERDAHVAG